jgi:XTP/dITP diphosphohydrolase
MELLFATANVHKVAEVRAIMRPYGVVVIGLGEAGPAATDAPEPVEDDETFAGNARIKAVHYATATGRVCLADDSGLEVDALGGAPGVRSARYAGALADPRGRILAETQGELEGVIADRPAGTNGFGYDPLLYLPADECTSAQLSPMQKNARSHRGQAARSMAALITEQGFTG